MVFLHTHADAINPGMYYNFWHPYKNIFEKSKKKKKYKSFIYFIFRLQKCLNIASRTVLNTIY